MEFNFIVHTLEQIEDEVKSLPALQQKTLLSRLMRLVSKNEESQSGMRQNQLLRFFAEWDANHAVTVGEKPTRVRTYADNSRLR